MTTEARNGEANESRSLTSPHVLDALGDEARCLRRIAPVAIANEQVGERAEVFGDVRTWRLQLALHRDAEPVVVDVEQHRELERRGDRQRGPEAVRRHRCLATQHDGDGPVPLSVAEHVAPVDDGLRPTRRGRVLRANVTGHRQHARSVHTRQVADHADVAPIAEAARPPERTAEGILDREPHGQHQRTASVVRPSRVMRLVEQRGENALAEVVPARGELVEHQMLARHRALAAVGRLLEVVQRARDEHVVRDPPPVEAGVDV